jgi:hypothetical protein
MESFDNEAFDSGGQNKFRSYKHSAIFVGFLQQRNGDSLTVAAIDAKKIIRV